MSEEELLAVAAVLVLLAAAGTGGWWLAADRGWIAGKPNSPRAKAQARHRRAPGAHRQREFVALRAGERRARARDGMGSARGALSWSPASFLRVVDPRASRAA